MVDGGELEEGGWTVVSGGGAEQRSISGIGNLIYVCSGGSGGPRKVVLAAVINSDDDGCGCEIGKQI